MIFSKLAAVAAGAAVLAGGLAAGAPSAAASAPPSAARLLAGRTSMPPSASQVVLINGDWVEITASSSGPAVAEVAQAAVRGLNA